MKITKTGFYKLTEQFTSRGGRSVRQFPAGTVLEVSQVDADGRKVIGPSFEDWAPDEMPCVPIEGEHTP